MLGDDPKQRPEPSTDEIAPLPGRWMNTVERGFFQILREDFLPPFRGRKKQRKRP